MRNKSPWKVLIAELSYLLFVGLAIYISIYLWMIAILPGFTKEGFNGLYKSIPVLVLIMLAFIVVSLYILRLLLLNCNVIAKEDSHRYIWSRTWYLKK